WPSAATSSFATFYGRRLSNSGAALGPEFLVSAYSTVTVSTSGPAVAAAADGSFVVAWKAYDVTYNIFARRYSSVGAPLGSVFRVNTSTTSNPRNPSVAIAGDGSSFVIVWNDRMYGYSHVFAQRYAASGAKLSTEFRVNTHTDYPHHTFPSVAADGTGNFTVVWSSFRQVSGPSNNDVFGQRYGSTGSPLGPEFLVNSSETAMEQHRARIASDASGNLTVVWQSGQGSTYAVVGQRFLSNGAPLGGQFTLSVSGSTRNHPAVAWSASAFVVAWSGNAYRMGSLDYGIFGKRYSGPGDINGDGVNDVNDVFYLINFLFAGGPAPIGP